MGDHGSILVAIKFNQNQRENVSYIMYSTDMGDSWQYSKLSDSPLRIYSLMTEPGENTTVFSLFGSPPGNEHHWIIVKADFGKVFGECEIWIKRLGKHTLRISQQYIQGFFLSLSREKLYGRRFQIVDAVQSGRKENELRTRSKRSIQKTSIAEQMLHRSASR